MLLGSLAAVIGTGAICRSISYESTGLKQLAWMTHCATLGAVLAPLCFLGGAVLIRAAWYTAGIVAGELYKYNTIIDYFRFVGNGCMCTERKVSNDVWSTSNGSWYCVCFVDWYLVSTANVGTWRW